jgi:hypothetical protein
VAGREYTSRASLGRLLVGPNKEWNHDEQRVYGRRKDTDSNGG